MPKDNNASGHILQLDSIPCPCGGRECPVIHELNEKLKIISRLFIDIEKLRRRKQLLRNSKHIFKAKDILNIRIKHRLTQQNLARILGVNVASVNRWEQGLAIPADKTQAKLCNLKRLGVRQVILN